MIRILILISVLLLASCERYQNVYNITAEEAFQRLAQVNTSSKEPPFGQQAIITRFPEKNKIMWEAKNMQEKFYCLIDIAPQEQTRARVNITCNGEGRNGPFIGCQWRPFIIELVDSTLRGRKYRAENVVWIEESFPPDPNKAMASCRINPLNPSSRSEAVNRALEEYEKSKADLR